MASYLQEELDVSVVVTKNTKLIIICKFVRLNKLKIEDFIDV